MEFIFKLDEIDETVKAVYEQAKSHKVWAFHAGMGSGKTTFIKALGKYLHITDTVSSPTYSIINQYKNNSLTICHMDWYRLKNEDEAIDAGIEDALQSGAFCFVEWPERAENLLPDDTLHIYIDVIDDTTRRLYTKI